MEQRYCYSCMRELDPDSDRCPHCGASNAACAAEQPEYALPCGTMLAGRYVVGRVLGHGGFGVTYIGRNLALDTRVCIKEYFPIRSARRTGSQSTAVCWGSDEHASELNSFVKEARRAGRLRDLKSVIQVRDAFFANETAYIVMDYIEGETLKTSLSKNGRRLGERECVALLTPVLTDLKEVHRRSIIHRDISPDNLMLRPDGTLMLLDLGALHKGFRKGFSPMEQYSKDSEIGPWTDVYSVCATVFWCVTGKLPPEPMERLMGKELDLSGLSPKLAAVLEKGLALKPGDRIQTVDELLEKLETAIYGPALKPWVLPLLTCVSGLVMICVGILGLSRGWWGEGASVEPAAASPTRAVETAAAPDVAAESLFRYEVVGSGVTVTGCDSDAAVLAIPAELAGKPVTAIGDYAFRDCGALTALTLPESVKKIGDWAFYGCNGLTELSVPAGVEEIGGGAFSNCASLRSIRADEGSAAFRNVDGVLFDKDVTELVQFPAGRSGSYAIPDGVTAVRRAAFFACRGLTELTLPDSVTAIGSSAFKACSGLKSVTVPGGVKEIPYQAFYGCSALADVTIRDGVTAIGKNAFSGCTALTDVTIPASVTVIGEDAFNNCTALKAIHVQSGSDAAKQLNYDKRLVLY